MKYLGGTADFDLWYRDDKNADPPPPNGDILPYLRVVRIEWPTPIVPSFVQKHELHSWDDFRVPLYLNVEIGKGRLPPEEQRLAGRWNDIQLTYEQVDVIKTYLRCFAPWALGEETSDV
jgi:hypothetical protein